MSDFWEQASWPRDSSGSGTTRFGLPVREDPDELDDELDDEFFISEAPNHYQASENVNRDDEYDEVEDFDLSSKNRAIQNNPYVLNVMDVEGIENEIVRSEKNCIVFMSARFCKTCKTINPGE